MTEPENDNDLAPHEQIEADFEAEEISFETAVVKMLSLIAEASWVAVIDIDKILSTLASKGETKH